MKNDPQKFSLAVAPLRLIKQFMARFTEAFPVGRNRRLAIGIASGVVTKGVAFLLTLITVPMTLHYLGPERYGIWVTVLSILAWLSMVDLGVANGLTPALSAAYGKNRNDLAQEYVATAFWGLILIAGISGLILVLFWGWLDWGWIFNIKAADLKQQVSFAMAIAAAIFLATLPLTITQRIYMSHQEGLVANFWQIIISLAAVAGIYIVTRTEGGLIYLVIGYLGTQFLMTLASTVWLFKYTKPHLKPFIYPSWSEAKHVMSLGGMFFTLQIATLVIYQKDNILITHYLGSSQAATYSVAWQMFLYLNVINILISPYLGPGFGEAYAKGDIRWMRKAFGHYMLATCGFAVPFVILFAWFYKPILAVWVGPEVVPTQETVFWLALWTLMLSIQAPMITLLNNTGRLRVFTIVYSLAALLNLPLSVILIKSIGVSGGIIASVITTAIVVVFPSLREVLILLRISRDAAVTSKVTANGKIK
jgi:O-antigen/teichoic acid export membrane protein